MSNIPPFFSDLGEAARNIFTTGFDYPEIKFSSRTKTESGVEFEAHGSCDLDTNRPFGSVGFSLPDPDYGRNFSASWNTNSELDTQVTIEPSSVSGLRISFSSSFLPSKWQIFNKLRTSYQREHFNVDVDVDTQACGTVLNSSTLSTVLMYNGWYAGYQGRYDISASKLTANNLAAGYQGTDFTAHASLENVTNCLASIDHKVSDKTEVGLTTTYNLQTSNVALGLAGKYTLSDGAVIKGKVNNQGQIGLGYSQKVCSCVKLSFSGLIEGQNINAGGHKVGFAVDFEPGVSE